MAEDAMLVDFLAALDDYIPTIPDELVDYYLSTAGFMTQDTRLTRLVGVATQKFISEVASDALQQTKFRLQSSRSAGGGQQQGKEKPPRLVLTSDDLSTALREFGVNVKRQEYYAESATTATTPQQQSSDQQLA